MEKFFLKEQIRKEEKVRAVAAIIVFAAMGEQGEVSEVAQETASPTLTDQLTMGHVGRSKFKLTS